MPCCQGRTQLQDSQERFQGLDPWAQPWKLSFDDSAGSSQTHSAALSSHLSHHQAMAGSGNLYSLSDPFQYCIFFIIIIVITLIL